MITLRDFLTNGQPSTRFIVSPSLPPEHEAFWPQANKSVLWGWKRDRGRESRAVFFSATLVRHHNTISVADTFFFYKHRTTGTAAATLVPLLADSRVGLSEAVGLPTLRVAKKDGMTTILYKIGVPKAPSHDLVTRLLLRRPRKSLGSSQLPSSALVSDIASMGPFDLYSGSGVSYEAGLPTLCDVHASFCLDDLEHNSFTFGRADLLPSWLATQGVAVLSSFCELHVKALSAKPSAAQHIIGTLWRAGAIRKVFSDNVDNMLSKVHVPFERTRGSGVFNERHPAVFESPTLLVVGVAADRRQIVQQARARRMEIVVVDPCVKVSHGVQHLNYLRLGDHFLKTTAAEFFPALVANLPAVAAMGIVKCA